MGRSDTEVLFRSHYGSVLGFCRGFAKSKEEDQDLTCEVFLRIVRSYSRFEGRSHVSTWIRTIARNVCFSHIARARKEKAGLSPAYSHSPDSFPSLILLRPSPIEAEEDARLGNIMIEKALGSIGRQTRDIVKKYYLEGMSQGEVARELGVSRPAIGKSLKRAKSHWQQMLLGKNGLSTQPSPVKKQRKAVTPKVVMKVAA